MGALAGRGVGVGGGGGGGCGGLRETWRQGKRRRGEISDQRE